MPSGRWLRTTMQLPAPTALWGHSVSIHNSTAIVFGGELGTGIGGARTDELWTAELHGASLVGWSQLRPRAPRAGTASPSARRQHAAAPSAPSELLLVGGMGDAGTGLADAWRLKMSPGEALLVGSRECPLVRKWHRSTRPVWPFTHIGA